MPKIIPISDLRSKTNQVVDLCHDGEPIFVTRNGEGELVVMSQALYEQMQARLELYAKLEEAEFARASGNKPRKHEDLMASLKSRLT